MRYLKINMIVALSLLFVACHKVDVEQHNDPAMMSFEPQLEAVGESLTRGTPITAVSQMKDIGVFVYNTGTTPWATAGAAATPNIMNNQKIEQKSAVWSYSPAKPWKSQYNTMFAYAPFATAANGITVESSYTAAPTIKYTVPTTYANQPDLMVAVTQQDKSSGTTSFAMEHALACVGFKVQGLFEEAITKIAVKGVSVSGTLSLNHTVGGVPLWSNIAAVTDTEYTSGVKDGMIGDLTPEDAMNVDGYLMMIPQTLGAGAKLILTVDGVEREVLLSGNEWKAGQQYIYNIDIKIDYPPIIVGYFGGWDGTEYTKKLQVDWEISKRDPLLVWSIGTSITNATNVHYGPKNIDILKKLNADLSNYPAAKYCEDINNGAGWNKDGGGWYLPSQNQLMAIWIAYEAVPAKFSFNANIYLTATEYDATLSKFVYFGDGGTWFTSKTDTNKTYRVRCVRDVEP